MKRVFSIRRKTRAALILGAVFVFIFANNWLDDRNVSKLGDSFASVYEDRLLVESYIYKLSDHLYRKKIMIDDYSGQESNNKLQSQIDKHNAAINTIILDYEKTKLTKAEDSFFQSFKKTTADIERLETDYIQAAVPGQEVVAAKLMLDKQYEEASANLHQLSEIQVSEGKLLNEKSKQIIAGSNILKILEVALLVCIGIIIQILILATKSVLPKIPHKPSLN